MPEGVALEPLGDSDRIARGMIRLARGCAQAHPTGVAPEPPGDSDRIARG